MSEVNVWCIQMVVGKDKLLVGENWVNMECNPDFKLPKHGSPVPGYKVLGYQARYHLTPFKKLNRKDYLP